MAKLSEYEQQRLEKIKRNEERLKELGLDKAKDNLKRSAAAPSRKRKKRAAATNITSIPQRSSRRLKRQPVLYEPLMDDEIIRKVDSNFKKQKQARTNKTNFKCEIPMDLKSSPLSEKEKDVITKKMEGDFLGKFEDYLTEVDELSHQNRRNVMRQVTKLHTGEGITYESKAYGWPDNCYFMQGKTIGPCDDILHLMEIAQTCEDDWGHDHGNGWLLRHPLKKLYMFQQYHLR